MLIEMQRRGVVPDLITFADTGGELPETIRFVEEFSAWLVDHGMPPVITVRDERRTLESEVREAGTLPSLVFGFRSCPDKYKVRPQERYLKTWQPALDVWAAGGKVVKLIGYDAGTSRAGPESTNQLDG
jgi:3'-phosphoadenosine 5'-phosphosulfate sulfotransferase (PAPS reductase)/FAD synthetase